MIISEAVAVRKDHRAQQNTAVYSHPNVNPGSYHDVSCSGGDPRRGRLQKSPRLAEAGIQSSNPVSLSISIKRARESGNINNDRMSLAWNTRCDQKGHLGEVGNLHGLPVPVVRTPPALE